MTNGADTELLQDLRLRPREAFVRLYRLYYRMVAVHVRKNGGTETDAEDVFQETLFVLVKSLQRDHFELSSKLSTFLYAIARNIWQKKKVRSREMFVDPQQWAAANLPEEGNGQGQEQEALLQAVSDKLSELEESCRSVLRMAFYQKMNVAEIAAATGYTESFVSVKKHRCLGYLRKLVQASAAFRNL